MRLGPLLQPVGPLPSAVYWRRRAVLGALVLGVLLLVALAARGLGGADRVGVVPGAPPTRQAGPAAPSPPPAPSPPGGASTPSPGPRLAEGEGGAVAPAPAGPAAVTPRPAAADPPACAAEDLSVEVEVSPVEARAGEQLTIRARVAALSRPCRLDVGPVSRAAEVRSGGAVVWSTEHCEAGDDSAPTVLTPGEPHAFAVRWEGRRTAAGCPRGLGAPAAGGHVAVVQVGPARSPEVPFRLT